MTQTLKKGDQGPDVAAVQQCLGERGYPVTVDGILGRQTFQAVRAFQAQNLDQHGQPLTVDGVVGPLTWWSLGHPKPHLAPPSAVDFREMPPAAAGGSRAGRTALAAAIGELQAGAGEVGGNNCGPWVRKYLRGMAPEGASWCAAFVSWCFAHHPGGIPFTYTLSARDLLRQLVRKGWAHPPGGGYAPAPGDIVVWWRERLVGWQGHVGLVYQLRDGYLYTLEGNKSPRVQGFSYVFSRMDRLLGFGQVPDA